jgi:hypothetical protein
MTDNLNPITNHNIEQKIDEAQAYRRTLFEKLRQSTDPDLRRTLAADLSLAGEYLEFLLSGEATKTEYDSDEPLTPEMRRALERKD